MTPEATAVHWSLAPSHRQLVHMSGPLKYLNLLLVWQVWWCTMWPCRRRSCSAAALRLWTLQRCLRRGSSYSCPPGKPVAGSVCTGLWWRSASGKCHRCSVLTGLFLSLPYFKGAPQYPMLHPCCHVYSCCVYLQPVGAGERQKAEQQAELDLRAEKLAAVDSLLWNTDFISKSAASRISSGMAAFLPCMHGAEHVCKL